MRHIPLVDVTRGKITETVHYGSFSIAFGGSGNLYSVGESSEPFFLRSSAKPFQTLAFLEHPGADRFNFTQEEIALMCASHSGTDTHVNTLIGLHQKLNLSEDLLQCGTHMPYDKTTAERMIRSGKEPRLYQSDCSGKHTAMLAFAGVLNASIKNYLTLHHPVQKKIIQTFSAMCAVSPEGIEFGLDGCSAPVFAIPLPNAAIGYANLCQPDTMPKNRSSACERITDSMAAHPFMVAGPHRFDTDLMRAACGKVIAKIGAEGYQALGILPHASPTGSSIGITIKIADGDMSRRASSVVAIAVLDHFSILDQVMVSTLEPYYTRPINNWRGIRVGEIRPSSTLLDSLNGITL